MVWENWIALIGVIGGLVGALVVALVSHQHDRQQQGRATLLTPAEHFSRSALTSLALLRYVTPPRRAASGGRRHRNECVLEDAEERRCRLIACRSAIDVVRADRAHVRLAFHPESRVATSSQLVLGQLRDCLEAAENFFDDYDEAAARATQSSGAVRTATPRVRVTRSFGQRPIPPLSNSTRMLLCDFRSHRGIRKRSSKNPRLPPRTTLIRPTARPQRVPPEGPLVHKS